ncbi:MAG TPA: hypothetical protein DCP02_05485 [Actinobacteria bacterium]|nr:hypothetical protein [Actinomycetota bacterium]
MSETARIWIEVSFDIIYLIVVWILVIAMYRHRSIVKIENQRVAKLTMIAFILLALGDTGHVGFRVVAYAMGETAPQVSFLGMEFGLRGIGTLSTAITVTLFYVLILAIWRSRFNKKYGPFQHLLFAAALIRLVMLALPVNQWDSPVPPQPWSIIRNLPLLIQGLGVTYLILRDARTNKDRTFSWIGIMILFSYACYMIVILFVQQIPLIGMLMMPKTMAYIAIGLLAYNALYRASPAWPETIKS